MESKDLSDFDKNVIDLLDLCKEAMLASEKRKLSVNDRKNPFLTRLTTYIKTYKKTEPEEHVGYFEKIYKNNKRFILLGPQRDGWLADSEIVITYGEEAGLKTGIKVHLSAIYSTVCRMRDDIREEMEGLPNSSEASETGYPGRMLLFLYRIFKDLTESDTEKEKLSTHISNMEGEIGIRSSKGDDPMSGLFDMTSGLMEQFTGNKMNKDQMPGKNDMSKMFSNMINDPKTKSMIGNVMEQLKNTNNIGDMATKLVGALGSGEGMGDILGQMGGGQSSGTAAPTETTGTTESNNNVEAGEGGVNDEFDDY